ncbi:L-alanine-DL-glutamate epimerase-like enolase superfamily enzyme [Paenarthrobacter nicotinovorans]|uniref:mandelate racemase/muconate lactonizing enzyme family protein n=1 Tax=Paenarthrobacter nicotinovorans TaxID=29320 RepID=UPI002780E068|nr:mandelate racemase/muconate lactonizing enzyme family protein [Paenarthrobacter nicotinovorans]MDP9936811.1 L-alanine-DL-glutamate epimerase-like enolase superfamily enzyme [Paenarthrobacter nicotinovorans]
MTLDHHVDVNRNTGQPSQSSTVVDIEIYELDIPFDDGSDGYGAPDNRWSRFDGVLIRLTTADGITGWGECFAYGCRTTVAEALRTMVIPLVLGQDAEDVPALMRQVQHKLHLFGRYGVVMFALSGVDIALWDRKARSRQVTLGDLVGGRLRDEVPAYASLVHYGHPELVRDRTRHAKEAGHTSVKLHETALDVIQAGRDGAGASNQLTVDANCSWTLEQARTLLPAFEAIGIDWLEEPIYPPEDFESLARLATLTAIPLSAGENACTRYEFQKMLQAKAVTHPQPSVTKVGGVTEFMAVLKEAAEHGAVAMPHSPYFGPGYWTTLQLLSAMSGDPQLEYLYVEPEAFPGLSTPVPDRGRVRIPDTPGTGFEPDWDVLRSYAPMKLHPAAHPAPEHTNG